MTKKLLGSPVLAALLAVALHAAPAQAQLFNTFVSANGSDANNCAFTTPCRTFQAAHGKTNDQGEIRVLDPGEYGTVTISKSISIVGNGEATIVMPTNTTGFFAGIWVVGTGTKVNLSGITVQGSGPGMNDGGLAITGTDVAVTVSNCVFRSTGGPGIYFAPSSGKVSLSVSNTLVANNRTGGIFARPFGNVTATITIDNVTAVNNGDTGIGIGGFSGTGTIDASVTNSVAANNAVDGIDTLSTPGQAAVTLSVIQTTATKNAQFGVRATGANTTLWLGQSTLTRNGIAAAQGDAGATLQSFGNNHVPGQTLTKIPLQ
jgi:parallel beta helix pectate lyase-like protein